MTSSRRPTNSDARLEELIEQATVDCYNEEEQVTGLFTMIEDNLAIPFEKSVLGGWCQTACLAAIGWW